MKNVLVTMRKSSGPPDPAPDQCTVECANPQEIADLGQLLNVKSKDGVFTVVAVSIEDPQQSPLPSHYAMAGFRALFR